jgi:hypothetical protein
VPCREALQIVRICSLTPLAPDRTKAFVFQFVRSFAPCDGLYLFTAERAGGRPAGTVETVVREGHRPLRSRPRFMFMQIRAQACAPASMLLHVTNRIASEPPAEITATCAYRYTMPVPTHGSCDEKTPDDETTTSSFRNTPLVSHQFHCTSVSSKSSDWNKYPPFFTGCQVHETEWTGFRETRERSLLSYGHSLLSLFTTHIFVS